MNVEATIEKPETVERTAHTPFAPAACYPSKTFGDKTITTVFFNSYSKYFWMHIVGFDGKYVWADRRSCDELSREIYGYDKLEYPYGVDNGERCLCPAIVCPYCRKFKIAEAFDYHHPYRRLPRIDDANRESGCEGDNRG